MWNQNQSAEGTFGQIESAIPSWGEMNRSQNGRAVRFTAAALQQRAKSKKTQSWRASGRAGEGAGEGSEEREPTSGRTDGAGGERVGAAAKRR